MSAPEVDPLLPQEGGQLVLLPNVGGRPAMDETSRRRSLIMTIREDLKLRNIFPDNYRVAHELKRYGIYVDIAVIYKDMKEIHKVNSYVLDMAKYNYNGIIEDVLLRMEMIMRGCDDIIAHKWTNSKVIVTETEAAGPDEPMTTRKQKVVTDELAGPKIQAYAVQKDLLRIYVEILKGGIVDTSIAILSRNVGEQKKALDNALAKIQSLEKIVDEKEEVLQKLKSGV